MNKFEQLIEYVINDEEAKAKGQKPNYGMPNFDGLEGWIVSA